MKPLTDISETLLLPLYARAMESQSKNPLLLDKKAVEITKDLNRIFEKSPKHLHQRLAKGKLRRKANRLFAAFIALRSRKIDQYCTEFLARSPDGIIFELGCGLSTRFSRLDNGRVRWIDLDLPEVIDWRRQFFQDTARYTMIASSALDHQWMDDLPRDKPILFVAEGLLMYLPPEQVKSLVLSIAERFPHSELVAELASAYLVKTLQKNWWRRKFQRDFTLGEAATFSFGVTSGNELATWGPTVHFLDEWTIFDDHEKKLGWLNLFANVKKIRFAQFIVHYRFE